MKQMLCKFLHFLPAILLFVKICKVSCISSPKIAVIGGGASGMFSAQAAGAACAENNIDAQVHVFESSSKLMSKVEISGGGRCNVLHDTTKPVSDILNGYPRGKKELNGPFNKHFSPTDARTWFQSRGVELKTEIDGRMFPVTDSSQTIMDCILSAAKENQVRINTRQKVLSVTSCSKADRETSGYTITFQNENKDEFQEHYDCVILATGSNPRGHELASSLGHKLTPPVPSLFTFNAKNQHKEGQIFHGLAGLSVQSSTITLKIQVEGKKKKKIIQQGGPLLITRKFLLLAQLA
jgi:predicted Rossmann fold flavoprotein